jgi:hypothetical protein
MAISVKYVHLAVHNGAAPTLEEKKKEIVLEYRNT